MLSSKQIIFITWPYSADPVFSVWTTFIQVKWPSVQKPRHVLFNPSISLIRGSWSPHRGIAWRSTRVTRWWSAAGTGLGSSASVVFFHSDVSNFTLYNKCSNQKNNLKICTYIRITEMHHQFPGSVSQSSRISLCNCCTPRDFLFGSAARFMPF